MLPQRVSLCLTICAFATVYANAFADDGPTSSAGSERQEPFVRRRKRQAQLVYHYQYQRPNLYVQPDGQMLNLLYPMYFQYNPADQAVQYPTGPKEVLVTPSTPLRDKQLVNELYSKFTTLAPGVNPHMRPIGRNGELSDEELLRSMYKKPGPGRWPSYAPGITSPPYGSTTPQPPIHTTSTLAPPFPSSAPPLFTSTHIPSSTIDPYRPAYMERGAYPAALTPRHPFPSFAGNGLGPVPTSSPPPQLPDGWEGPPPPLSHIGRVPPRRLPTPDFPHTAPAVDLHRSHYHAPEARITTFGHAIIHDHNQ